MQITEFWDWDAAFGLQTGVTPISCVSLMASTFPLMSARSPQFGGGTFPPVSWDGVLHCPSPTSSVWLPLVSSVSAIQGWRSNRGWTVAPGLPGPAGMGGGGGLGQKQRHQSTGTSVRRAEPWSQRAT